MDSERFKSVAINIASYRMLRELADKRFELPISLSKTTEFLIKKSHDEYKKMESQTDKKLQNLKTLKEHEYGSFSGNMNKIAAAWNLLLKDQLRLGIEPWQVALMYAQAKLIRISYKYKADSYIDAELYLQESQKLQQPITEEWLKGYKKWKKK